VNATGEGLAGLELTETKWDFKPTTEVVRYCSDVRQLFAYHSTLADLGGPSQLSLYIIEHKHSCVYYHKRIILERRDSNPQGDSE